MRLFSLSAGFLVIGLYCARERSLMRGQLPSFPYLTWLSLPFQWFFVHCGFCHLFMFFWYRDIRFVPVQESKRFKKGIFVDWGRETHGVFEGVGRISWYMSGRSLG